MHIEPTQISLSRHRQVDLEERQVAARRTALSVPWGPLTSAMVSICALPLVGASSRAPGPSEQPTDCKDNPAVIAMLYGVCLGLAAGAKVDPRFGWKVGLFTGCAVFVMAQISLESCLAHRQEF